MQTTLLLNCIFLFKNGVTKFNRHKFTSQPFLIGISGDSGTGKTTFANLMTEVFGRHNSTILNGDDMHKWCRNHSNWIEFTHLNPLANNLQSEYRDLCRLKIGRQIMRREYDHSSGTFNRSTVRDPNRLVIFEGLHAFYLPEIRDLFDLKVFIDTDIQLADHWKILRDSRRRGHDIEHIRQQIQKRRSDRQKYIEFQKILADIIISPYNKAPISRPGESGVNVELAFKMMFRKTFFLDEIIQAFQAIPSLKMEHCFNHHGEQELDIEGNIYVKDVNKIAALFLPELEELGIRPIWVSGPLGIVQFLVVLSVVISIRSNDLSRLLRMQNDFEPWHSMSVSR
mgnify:CR=1 FL=1